MKYGVDYIGIFVAAVCFDQEGNFLMGKRGGQARDRHVEWDFPGGSVELGETFEDALVREFGEECGVAPTNCKLAVTREFLERGMHYVGFYYVADIDRAKVRIAGPVYDEFSWFTVETLPDEISPEIRERIKELVSYK